MPFTKAVCENTIFEFWFKFYEKLFVRAVHNTPAIVQMNDSSNRRQTITWASDNPPHHDNDVIVSTMASQITCLTNVYSNVNSDTDQRKHQSLASLAFVWGIHRDRRIPPPPPHTHKGPVTRKMFPFDDVIMKWLHRTGDKSLPEQAITHLIDTNIGYWKLMYRVTEDILLPFTFVKPIKHTYKTANYNSHINPIVWLYYQVRHLQSDSLLT